MADMTELKNIIRKGIVQNSGTKEVLFPATFLF